ncbi:MAG: hypothetical protein KGZ69_09170 [Methylomonas sp.]|nr:hypothetical protein [Methylomonas sp.]
MLDIHPLVGVFNMQAIELETDITPDGHIQLPSPLRNVFGRHARLILLLDERQPADSPSLRQANDTDAFLSALAGGLSEDFPNDIDETDLGIDTPRRELD